MYKSISGLESAGDDVVVWRYHDLPRYMDLLLRSQIFFNQIGHFEDPYEGNLTAPDNVQAKDNTPHVAVNTWHMNAEENYAMWNIYARGSYGLAIQSTFKKLKDAFTDVSTDVFINKVMYINDNNTDDTNVPLYFRKRSIYAFENELRCCILLEDKSKALDAQDSYTGVFVNVNLEILIDRIFISPYSPEWFKDLVSRINTHFNIGADIVHSSVFDRDDMCL